MKALQSQIIPKEGFSSKSSDVVFGAGGAAAPFFAFEYLVVFFLVEGLYKL